MLPEEDAVLHALGFPTLIPIAYLLLVYGERPSPYGLTQLVGWFKGTGGVYFPEPSKAGIRLVGGFL